MRTSLIYKLSSPGEKLAKYAAISRTSEMVCSVVSATEFFHPKLEVGKAGRQVGFNRGRDAAQFDQLGKEILPEWRRRRAALPAECARASAEQESNAQCYLSGCMDRS